MTCRKDCLQNNLQLLRHPRGQPILKLWWEKLAIYADSSCVRGLRLSRVTQVIATSWITLHTLRPATSCLRNHKYNGRTWTSKCYGIWYVPHGYWNHLNEVWSLFETAIHLFFVVSFCRNPDADLLDSMITDSETTVVQLISPPKSSGKQMSV